MPICDDPNACGYYVLRGDRDKQPRPMFKVKFFTRAQGRDIKRKVDEAREEPDDDVACDMLMQNVIGPYVVGWQNMGEEFTPENLEKRLRSMEIWELALNLGAAVTLTEEDLKNFASPATSAPGSSAEAAGENAQKTAA